MRTRRGSTAGSNGPPPPRIAVFTSVDGALLDACTFDPGAARAAVWSLHAAAIPVVPVSVMTLDELTPIAADLGLQRAMVVEAGAAIARWTGSAWEVEPCGPPAETLLDVVRDIEDRSGASLLVYSALSAAEAAHLSGRSGARLEASARLCFSEPFVLDSGDLEAVQCAAVELGFSVRRSRRFLHLCRECDQGEAFSRVRDELRCEVTVAVGTAAVHAEYLSRADVAIIVPGPDGEPDRALLAELPGARIAPAPGPDGWAAAVTEVVEILTLPGRRASRA